MYSPKIRDDLIPRIYQIAKSAGMHMTTWVNEVLARELSEIGEPEETSERKTRKERNNEAGTVREERRES